MRMCGEASRSRGRRGVIAHLAHRAAVWQSAGRALLVCAVLFSTATAGLPAPRPARADSFCLGEINLVAGLIADNLFVPADASCTITGARLLGNVTIQPGAFVRFRQVELLGNLAGDGAANLIIEGSAIYGVVQANDAGNIWIGSSEIAGTVSLEFAKGAVVVVDNRVLGRMSVSGDTVICEDNLVFGELSGCP